MAFWPVENITENIKKVFDAESYCTQKKMEGLLLSIDFKKAFDTVEHEALIGMMKWFNFGETIRQWTKLLFTDFFALCDKQWTGIKLLQSFTCIVSGETQ